MKKLIFDVDGTILDSMHIWVEPQSKLFAKYGFNLANLSKEEKAKIEALSVDDMCQYIADEIATDMTFDEVMQYFDDIVYTGYKDLLLPKPGNLEILKKLKDAGFWIYATDLEGEDIRKCDFSGKVAIIIGNEGKGVSKNVLKNSDKIITIPNFSDFDSLNASVAAAIVMYEMFR